MRKLYLIFALFFISLLSLTARGEDIIIDYNRNDPSNHGEKVNRMPMRIPVQVSYDITKGIIEVGCASMQEGETFIYDENGVLIGYAPSLNSVFPVNFPAIYYIHLEGENWIGNGVINGYAE
ncbi:MAG: hypothetical protein K2J48_03755 [Muribaculaceae bacterium]|nr:hypothetical protein [Muribaculaceae bacterium]